MWDLLFGERVAKCCKVRRVRGVGAELRRSETGGWSLSNVVHCGSAHVCPLCAHRRARDVCAIVGAAIDKHRRAAVASDVWMLTLTVPHSDSDDQRALVRGLVRAWSSFTTSRQWKRFRRRWGVRAVVRVFDATFGSNGLHPHWHVGLFVDHAAVGFSPLKGWSIADRAMVLEDTARDELADAWTHAAVKAGLVDATELDAHHALGAHLAGAEEAAAYFAKWGLADELTMGPLKRSTQWDLLDAWGAGDELAGDAFTSYYRATKGIPIVTGIKAMRDELGIDDELVERYVERQRAAREAVEPRELVEPIAVVVPVWLHPAAVAVGWHRLQRVAELAGAAGAQRAVEIELLAYNARAGPQRLRYEGAVELPQLV